MPKVTELELYDLPIHQEFFSRSVDSEMMAARSVHPWLAKRDAGIIITEYDALDDIMRMDDKLKTPASHIVEIMGGEGTKWARFQREGLLARDGPDHDRIRASVSKAFGPTAVKAYRERIRATISDVLDEWAPKGRFDFEAFASRFPVAVMFGLLGIPRGQIEEVKYGLEMLGQSFSLDPTVFPEINRTFNQLWEFAESIVDRRKAQGTDGEPDLLDVLIESEVQGSINRIEMLDLILVFFAAGYDTSKNQMGNIMNIVLDRPELWERCAEDRSFCDDLANEGLRHTGVVTTYRNVAADMHYRDVTFPAGTLLIFPLGIVSRYTGPFEDPTEFRPGRPHAIRHTGFGRGLHMCLGQHLAKLQIAEGLHMMSKRLRNPRRDGEVAWLPFPGVWGPKHLPIAFEPA